jgi:hypothetical protein
MSRATVLKQFLHQSAWSLEAAEMIAAGSDGVPGSRHYLPNRGQLAKDIAEAQAHVRAALEEFVVDELAAQAASSPNPES